MCNFDDSKADRVVDFSILHDEIHIYNVYIDIRFGVTIKEQNGLCSGMALIVLLNIPCLLNKSICGHDRYFYSPMKTIVDIPAHL